MKTVTWGRAGVKTMGEVLAALLDLSGHGPRDGDPQADAGQVGHESRDPMQIPACGVVHWYMCL